MPEQQPTLQNAKAHRTVSEPLRFPPLEMVNQPNVPTEQAAYYLNRRPQTMRLWACHENGPLRPIRVHGRLAWPVTEIRRIVGGEVAHA